MRQLKLLFWSILGAGIATFLLTSTAFAGNLTVTNTNPAPTVGTNIPSFTITIDIATAANIANGENITVTFPYNFPQVAVTDANDGKIGLSAMTLGGHNVYGADDGVTEGVVGRILTVTIADVADIDGGVNALTDGDDLVMTFITTTDTAGTAIVTDDADWTPIAGSFGGTTGETFVVTGVTTMVLTAADAAVTVGLGTNSVVGAAGNTTLTLTTHAALAATDTVVFTMPANLEVSGLVAAATGTFDSGDNITCAVTSGQTITCTAGGAVEAAPSGRTLILAGIRSKYTVASGMTVTNLAVNNVATGSGADISADSASTDMTATTAQLSPTTNASIAFANAAAGATQSTTVNVTLPISLVSGDTIEFTLPASVYPAGLVESNSAQSFGGGGTFDCVDTAQAILCTADGAVTVDVGGETGTITLVGVTGKYVADAAELTDFQVEYQGGATADMAVDTTVAVPAVTVGALTSSTVTPRDMTASQYNSHTIAFTTQVPIPNLGIIKITYPSGWNVVSVNGLKATNLSGLDGEWTASVSGQVITLTQTSGSESAPGAKSLKLESIKTPVAAGSGGNATILTELANGTDIQTLTTVSTGTVVPGTNTSSWDSSTTTTTTTTTTEEETTTTEEETTTTEEETTTTEEETTTTEEETTSEPVEVTTSSGETVTITDISEHWADPQIEAMVTEEIVTGNPDGSFKPDANLNRAEAAALLYRVLGLDEPATPTEKPFSDVAVDSWYAGYVNELLAMQLVSGNPDGTYRPGNSINRAEFLTLAMNVYYYLGNEDTKAQVDTWKAGEKTTKFADLKDSWYTSVVTAAVEMSLVNGSACGEDKCFNAENLITRAEATVMLYNMFYTYLTVDNEEVITEPQDNPAAVVPETL